MIQVRNDVIPFRGYKAMTLWPFIFIRRNARFNEVDLNHENIHGRQQLEMLLVLFLVWYGIEWFLRRVGGDRNAYRDLLFEQEAYGHERDLAYLRKRRPFAWLMK